MGRSLGQSRSVFYFNVCGQVNTAKTLELAAQRAQELGIKKMIVLQAANSVNFFKRGSVQIKEIICKPRNPTYDWPINRKDWVGDLEPYKKFVK